MKSRGFSGTIINASLRDVIQLICMGRGTCLMRVRSGNDDGVIQFSDGEIVHAQNREFEGVEAFYRIVSWNIGIFECSEKAPARKTIDESWDYLLMESLRRIDSL